MRRAVKIEPAVSTPLHGVKLLLVDDYADALLLISRRLKHLGASLDVAHDGREAVDMALRGDYDAILMDLQMPVLDGFEATQFLRAKNYLKPIIALTAHVIQSERERILRSGFDDYVAKPLEPVSLVAAVLKAVCRQGRDIK
jgi:CheY-like chemotaxis protein